MTTEVAFRTCTSTNVSQHGPFCDLEEPRLHPVDCAWHAQALEVPGPGPYGQQSPAVTLQLLIAFTGFFMYKLVRAFCGAESFRCAAKNAQSVCNDSHEYASGHLMQGFLGRQAVVGVSVMQQPERPLPMRNRTAQPDKQV